MHLDRLASLLVARPLLATGLLRVPAGIPVLMYHSIAGDPEPGVAPYYRLTTSPARFRDQMRWLSEAGYTVVGLLDAIGRLAAGGIRPHDRVAAITFDDGLRDFEEHAWPVLAAHGFTATVFVPTAFIGHTRRAFKGRDCLTWPEIRELHACGVIFGSHTVTHPRLNELPWDRVRSELSDSRARLEDELQAPVETFAYPYAFPQEDRRFLAQLRSELAAQRYRVAVTTVIGRAGVATDPLCVRRLPINDCDDAPLFAAKLAGAYDWLGAVQKGRRRLRRSTAASAGARGL